VPNPNRRRQCDDKVRRFKTWSEPLVINTLDNPAILGNYRCEPSVTLLNFSVNAIIKSRVVPKEIIKIVGGYAELYRELRGDIGLCRCRDHRGCECAASTRGPSHAASAEDMNVQMRHGFAAVLAVVDDQPVAAFV